MTSEVKNILKGIVVSTAEYESSKKTIGVSTKNLTPGENGIAPLEKQGAFEIVETIDFTDALSEAQNKPVDTIEETLDLPVLDSQPLENSFVTPTVNDVIEEKPVHVENPNRLEEFGIPNVKIPEVEVKDEVPEKKPLDIEMPQMPDAVVADEPEFLDTGLFETNEKKDEIDATLEELPKIENNISDEKEEISLPETPVIQPGDIDIPTFDIEVPSSEEVVENIKETEDNIVRSVEEKKSLEELPVIDDKKEIITEDLPQENENKTNDLTREKETQNISINASEVLNVIEKHKEIILNCANSISMICEELNKASKSLEELISQVKKNNLNTPNLSKAEELVGHSHDLVNDALDRISVMGGPRL